tara:strand:+ start:9997 stop:10341 length:345 start_codon:yes stop_codon:yes gene_type:complete
MTTEQIQKNQQELYNSIFNLGVETEKKRVNSWLESDLQNKWQIRDGIKSGNSFTETNQSDISNFYGNVDEMLNSKSNINSENNRTNIVENKEPDYYQKLEAQDFYDEVDSMFKK